MKYYFTFFIILFSYHSNAQNASITGKITTKDLPVAFADVILKNTEFGGTTNTNGEYEIQNIPAGDYTLTIKYLGYITINDQISIEEGQTLNKNYQLQEDALNLDGVVISGTRYSQDRVNNPIVVGVLDAKLFNATQSMAIAEGLNFNPGVRVETNCQNCGFTQVRLNGLEGAYSQILINSRPVFSALNSVYGLDQIPTSIVDRVEVVRSGGSALYGSNAIAGTINIITKEPVLNSWELSSNTALIDGDALDQTINMNASIVNEELTSGVTVYGMNRNRDSYDANDDGFTELVKLENTVFGAKAFLKPTDYSKITLDFSALEEYRRGGDRLVLAPHFTDITEKLDHNTLFAGINYEQWSKDYKNKYTIYASGQRTNRDSYYGGLGGGRTAADSTLALNAYGITEDLAIVAGVQYNHYFDNNDVLTAGIENQTNDTQDEIAGYNRLVDQRVNTTGVYAQYEWKPNEKITALLGGRYDVTNVKGDYSVGSLNRSSDVNVGIFSPRFTLLYKINDNLRFRGGYARGFRAPQAFNEDLHISSAGGDQVFTILSDGLDKETSDAFTASFNYTKSMGLSQLNFLVEGFYTSLNNPFTQVNTGTQPGGIIVEEVVNGKGATVSGLNFEAGYSPNEKFTFQLGGTVQQTEFDEPQEFSTANDNTITITEFTRNPNLYGYFTSFYKISDDFKIDFTGTYTGSMIVPRLVGGEEFFNLIDSDPFLDANLKFSYNFSLTEDFEMEVSSGFRNIFNSYQDEFDVGPTRDSDFIFGPAAPRSVFVGVKIGG